MRDARSDIDPAACAALRRAGGDRAIVGAIVLGSGLGRLLERWRPFYTAAAETIPGCPPAGVAGHAGGLALIGSSREAVLVFPGRVHFYEGHNRAAVTYRVRLAAAVGARWLLLTNASGAVDPRVLPGTALVIDDHVRLLLGPRAVRSRPADAPGAQAVRLRGSPYHPGRTEEAFRCLSGAGLRTMRGVLFGGLGPSYETAAEVEMIRRLGATAACMSTVIEAEEAARLGLEVVGLSLVTNLATGLAPSRLTHEEVVAVGAQAGEKLAAGVAALVRGWLSAGEAGVRD